MRFDVKSLIPARYLGERSDAALDSPVITREVARTQRIVEGQNFEIRRTLARYSALVEQQHDLVVERRRAVLSGDYVPGVWNADPARRRVLVNAAGEEAVVGADRTVTLACIDRAWRDHLALCADLREGIHLVRLGGQEPLTRFATGVIRAFAALDDAIDEAVLASLESVQVVGGQIDLTATGLQAPSATWTYLVNDDPFRDRLAALLTGPGGVTVAMYSALFLTPLLIVWGLVARFLPRRSRP